MGIPIEIVGEGIDWPAWVQAIGSIVAIFASAALAIAIDQGAARRAESHERRLRAQAVRDWESCLTEVVQLLKNASQLANESRSDALDDKFPARLVDNAIMMIDAYLRLPPPNPNLAFVLAAARSFIELPRDAIRKRRDTDPKVLEGSYSVRLGLADGIRDSLAEAAKELAELEIEYHTGIL